MELKKTKFIFLDELRMKVNEKFCSPVDQQLEVYNDYLEDTWYKMKLKSIIELPLREELFMLLEGDIP